MFLYSFASMAELGCQAVKVINPNSLDMSTQIPIAMMSSEKNPFELLGHIDGITLKGTYLLDSAISEQMIMVSIEVESGVFSSADRNQAIIRFETATAEGPVLYAIQCALPE